MIPQVSGRFPLWPLQCIAERTHIASQKGSDYNKRAKVEAAVGRWKQVIGD
jgi:hypothetical protein